MKLKTITVLFAFLIMVIIILADRDELGFAGRLYDFPNGDKVGHFVLYGILSFLISLTFLRSLPQRDPRKLVWVVTISLAVVVGLEEWLQRFFPERTSDWIDLFASYLGIALGAWLAWRMRTPSVKSESQFDG